MWYHLSQHKWCVSKVLAKDIEVVEEKGTFV
jgi:hypothetical protein